MAIIAHWCIEKNIYGPPMAKNIYGSQMVKNIYGYQMAIPWPKIFMALPWPKILVAPITFNTYRVFELGLYENKRLLGHQKCTFKS